MKFKLFATFASMLGGSSCAASDDLHYCFVQAGQEMYRLEDVTEGYKVIVQTDDHIEFNMC